MAGRADTPRSYSTKVNETDKKDWIEKWFHRLCHDTYQNKKPEKDDVDEKVSRLTEAGGVPLQST